MSNHLDARPLGYSLVGFDSVQNIRSNCQIKPANIKFFRLRNSGVWIDPNFYLLVMVYIKIRINLFASESNILSSICYNWVHCVESIYYEFGTCLFLFGVLLLLAVFLIISVLFILQSILNI